MTSLIDYIKKTLQAHFAQGEAASMTRILTEYITGMEYARAYVENPKIDETKKAETDALLRRIIANEPIQYIVGRTWFFDLPFVVNRDTLIPRPETEELVAMILDGGHRKDVSILDIGTGSGCIAVSLANMIEDAKVSAWDFSEGALVVAKRNAEENSVEVNFEQVDVLGTYPTDKAFDIIVSNPPYICESERKEMDANVLDYEPSSALFVPDDNALLFYKRIADIGNDILKRGGWLYFEINRAKGEEMVDMLTEKGYTGIELIKDISGNDRIVKAQRQ